MVARRIYPPVWIWKRTFVAERRLNRLARTGFQPSLRDEAVYCCRIHGINPVATLSASLCDALLHACRKAIPRYNVSRLWRTTSRQTKTA
jgi:hypothetical protein